MRASMTATEYAPNGAVFADGCFDSQVGKVVPLRMGRVRVGRATIVAYEIVDEGRAVELKIEIEERDYRG